MKLHFCVTDSMFQSSSWEVKNSPCGHETLHSLWKPSRNIRQVLFPSIYCYLEKRNRLAFGLLGMNLEKQLRGVLITNSKDIPFCKKETFFFWYSYWKNLGSPYIRDCTVYVLWTKRFILPLDPVLRQRNLIPLLMVSFNIVLPLCLGLPSGHFSSEFQTNIVYVFLTSLHHNATWQSIASCKVTT